MANYQAVETQVLSVSSSNTSHLTFEDGVQQFYISCDVDCFVDFDQPADAGSLLFQADQSPVRIDLRGGNTKKVYAITGGGTGSLYVMGVRN